MGESLIFCAQFLIIGAKITTTGVLFKNADKKEIAGRKRKLALCTPQSFCGSKE